MAVKHIFNQDIVLVMHKYINSMTPDVLNDFVRKISDKHQHYTRNTTRNVLYVTSRGTRWSQKHYGPYNCNFIINNINPNCSIAAFTTLRPTKMVATFKTTIWNLFSWMKMYDFRLRFHWSLTNCLINNIPTLVQIMALCRPGDKPLSELMMVYLLTHICVTRPRWVKENSRQLFYCR